MFFLQSSWTQRAIGSFQRMCCDRTLVAAVHSYQDNFLLLFLCETSTDEDIYTHLALHEEGHALLCTTTYGLVWPINNFDYAYVNKSHLCLSDLLCFSAVASSCLDSSIRWTFTWEMIGLRTSSMFRLHRLIEVLQMDRAPRSPPKTLIHSQTFPSWSLFTSLRSTPPWVISHLHTHKHILSAFCETSYFILERKHKTDWGSAGWGGVIQQRMGSRLDRRKKNS